ncbi:MAG: methylated-DNA--[protein]-cysteine S-methyltransferase, partial [Candidatus Bathyarchaeota archaeon]|nr:methylated-DNA--[protein]-cysteine S-methyltransferase [Candidatus Bathyarchaeota archaeon]
EWVEKIYIAGLETPLGTMWAAASEKGLVQFSMSGDREGFMRELKARIKAEYVEDPIKFKALKAELARYFEGEELIFKGPFDMRGTPFQVEVWKALHSIPYGKLTSYGGIAKQIGRPKAVRAVGNAVGDNPMGLILPCHRVVSSSGGIGGFSTGLEWKRKLLAQEGIFDTPKGKPETGVDLRQYFR